MILNNVYMVLRCSKIEELLVSVLFYLHIQATNTGHFLRYYCLNASEFFLPFPMGINICIIQSDLL